jgi:hypothetical protein
VALPPLFAPNIVQGKSYDLADSSVAPYFAELLRLTLGTLVELDFSQPWHRPGPVFSDPRLGPYRLGQSSFKAVVLDTCIAAALSAGHTYRQSCKLPTSARSLLVVSTGSTTACCCAQTSTPFLTGAI